MSRSLIKRLASLPWQFKTQFDIFFRRERLRVYLAHGALAVCLIHGRFRPTVAERDTVQLSVSDAQERHDIADALAALMTWMETRSFNGKVEWIVGFDHVHYVLLPWNEQLSGMPFCHKLAKALFSQQHGRKDSVLPSGKLRFAPLSYGYPRLAAFIPEATANALISFSWRERRRTASITPALALVWDRFFDRFKKGAGTLALIEGKRLLRVVYEHGNIVALIVRPFSEIHARSALSGVSFMFPPTGFNALEGEELPVRGLETGDDKRIAYALCGVL